MKKILFFLLLLFCITFSSYGINGSGTFASPYNGPLTTNMTWSGTVYVNGDVTVNGFRLTISPGAVIIFLASGSDIIITGTGILSASGTSANMIRFTADFNNNGIYGEAGERWGHISFQNMTVGFSIQSTIDYCIIEFGKKNSSPSNIEAYGGGIQTSFTYLSVSNSIIRNNFAGWGGGIFVNKNASPTISNCRIESNTSASSGGGLYIWSTSSSRINNCLIVSNASTAGGGGGGLFLGDACSNVRIYNSTIASNSAITTGKNIHFYYNNISNRPAFINCIVWNPANSISYTGQIPAISDFTNCAIQGYTTGYTSCINLNGSNNDQSGPNFTNPLTGDYSITFLSPCIDKGTDIGASATDIIGNPRVGITDIGAYENQDYTWLGTDGTNPTFWSVGGNWNHGIVPSTGNIVGIRGGLTNYPVVNTNATVGSITIASGGKLTIGAANNLIVSGTLTNNAGITGLVIKSDATGDGKLMNNTVSVPATVELYLTGGLVAPGVGRYHYFIPPVTTMSIGTVPTVAEVRAALGLTYFNGSLFRFIEPQAIASKEAGWQYFDNYPGTPPGFTSLQSTEGYNLYFNGPNDVLKFNGMLNAGPVTFNLSYTPANKGAGWNLVGNPYPCNYDLNGVAGLGTVVAGIGNTVYYNNNGNYTYWNVFTNTGSSVSYSDIVPPMTGFFVYVTNSSFTQLVLPVSSKTATSGDPRTLHKKSLSDSGSEVKQVYKEVKLVLTSGLKSDETIVLLADDAVNSYNEHYDAFKLFDSDSAGPNIYSEMEGVDYFMKAVPGLASAPVVVPLKLVLTESGLHTINISEFENFEGTKVVLKHGSVEKTLNKNTSYSFNSVAGTFTDFKLIIGGTDLKAATELPETVSFKTWYSNNSLYLNISGAIEAETGSFIITDYNGRQVYNNRNLNIVPGETTQIPINLDKGFYVTDILINNIHYKSKFVVF